MCKITTFECSFDGVNNSPSKLTDHYHHNNSEDSNVAAKSMCDGRSLSVTEISDQDLKLLEMKVYDTYREDGAPYSYDCLVDCRQKLMRKLDYYRKEVQVLK